MEGDLSIGDLVTPTHVKQPDFDRQHGFGVILQIKRKAHVVAVASVKFFKSQSVIDFVLSSLRRYE